MKTKVIFILTLFLSTGAFCQDKPDVEKEKEAIKAVIEGLLKDHAECDHVGWTSAWINQPYIFLSYTDKSSHRIRKGYDEIHEKAKSFFTRTLEEDRQSGRFLSLDPCEYTFRVYSESAWAQFKIRWTERYKGKEGLRQWVTFENYWFEKADGRWKIASISAVDLTSYEEKSEGN
jgi:hypothetical protein